MSLNKTNIDWARNPDGTPGFTVNLISGCLNHTEGKCNGAARGRLDGATRREAGYKEDVPEKSSAKTR